MPGPVLGTRGQEGGDHAGPARQEHRASCGDRRIVEPSVGDSHGGSMSPGERRHSQEGKQGKGGPGRTASRGGGLAVPRGSRAPPGPQRACENMGRGGPPRGFQMQQVQVVAQESAFLSPFPGDADGPDFCRGTLS